MKVEQTEIGMVCAMAERMAVQSGLQMVGQ